MPTEETGQSAAAPAESAPLEHVEDIISALNEEETAPDNDQASGDDITDDADLPDLSGDDKGNEDDAAPADNEGQPAAVAAPASWTNEEKELFGKLSPELQQTVARRESEREKAVQAKAQEAATVRQERDHIAGWAQANLAQALFAAQVAVEHDFAGIDWTALQKNDPVTFLQLDAQRKERHSAVDAAIAKAREFHGQRAAYEAAESQKVLAAELDKAMPVIKELVGPGFETAKYKSDLTQYLKDSGVPEQAIGNISTSFELEIATKAMLFDRMQQGRKQAEQKVAAAPKLQQAKSAVAADGKRQAAIKAAERRLAQNPNNTDSIIALLAAQEG